MTDSNPLYLLTEDDGTPIGTVDLTMIEDGGSALAFALAEVANDEDAIARVQEQHLAKHGVDNFGYVAASALTIMTRFILGPAFQVCQAYGTDLQAGLAKAVREGREQDPKDGVSVV